MERTSFPKLDENRFIFSFHDDTLFSTVKSQFPAYQNNFPINHALLSMEKSSGGRNFNSASKNRTKKSILKLNGPLFRNWMKIVSFSAFTATCLFQCSNLRLLLVKITFQSTTLFFRWKRAVLDTISTTPAKAVQKKGL